MGNEFSSSVSKRKWKQVTSVYNVLERRLQIQKQIDKLNIQFDELTDKINTEKTNLQTPNKDNIDNPDDTIKLKTDRDDTLLHNSLLYSSTLPRN